jgi:hypothetical protein
MLKILNYSSFIMQHATPSDFQAREVTGIYIGASYVGGILLWMEEW